MNLTHRALTCQAKSGVGPCLYRQAPMRRPVGDEILLRDNLLLPQELAAEPFLLVFFDSPCNTGRTQRRLRSKRKPTPAATGSASPGAATAAASWPSPPTATRSRTTSASSRRASMGPPVLKSSGTLYLHVDYREAHYCKLLLDKLFGRDSFLNEIIWAYDYGARTTRRWPAKHDTILVYVRDAKRYHFDAAEVDRKPYMAPGLVTAERAARGKLPTDVWWHTIVPTNGAEKTGYPTQKPEGIVRRMVLASTRPATGALTSSRATARSAPWRQASAPLRPHQASSPRSSRSDARAARGVKLHVTRPLSTQ